MAFKPRGQGKSPADLMGLLVNSKVQTENNALYQTIYGLITQLQNLKDTSTTKDTDLQKQIDSLDLSSDSEIPGFFFMGSS